MVLVKRKITNYTRMWFQTEDSCEQEGPALFKAEEVGDTGRTFIQAAGSQGCPCWWEVRMQSGERATREGTGPAWPRWWGESTAVVVGRDEGLPWPSPHAEGDWGRMEGRPRPCGGSNRGGMTRSIDARSPKCFQTNEVGQKWWDGQLSFPIH